MRIPAMERDFEKVCTTSRLSYLSISGTQLSPPKSTYASSMMTTESGFALTISSHTDRSAATPVGAFGFAMTMPPFSRK